LHIVPPAVWTGLRGFLGLLDAAVFIRSSVFSTRRPPPHHPEPTTIRGSGAQGGGAIVWITKGVGDYLNVSDRPWSHRTGATNDVCQLPGPEGTLVIDDGSGEIIGVYPESPGYPHPRP
jgi:hypothetical protein